MKLLPSSVKLLPSPVKLLPRAVKLLPSAVKLLSAKSALPVHWETLQQSNILVPWNLKVKVSAAESAVLQRLQVVVALVQGIGAFKAKYFREKSLCIPRVEAPILGGEVKRGVVPEFCCSGDPCPGSEKRLGRPVNMPPSHTNCYSQYSLQSLHETIQSLNPSYSLEIQSTLCRYSL